MMSDTREIVVRQTLTSEEMQRQFNTLLPPSIKSDKFTEVTIAAIQNSPEVLEADKDSLYRACLQAARRGLLPDKREGALVVFNTNVGTQERPQWMKLVQFMAMVEGIIHEMAKAGVDAFAVSVYANDQIRLWNDDEGQHVMHEPVTFGEQGEFVGVFAAGKTATGRTYVEAMNKADIEQVRARSKQKAKDGSPAGTWKTDYDRMAQKSALHRLRKRLPITDEEALQNLKDMEEESDIDLGAQPPSTAAPTQAAPPPPAQAALEAPKANLLNELSKPKPRRSRVLAGLGEQAQTVEKPAAAQVAEPKKAEPVKAPVRQEEEVDERDII
jgi:recombination protein RecT